MVTRRDDRKQTWRNIWSVESRDFMGRLFRISISMVGILKILPAGQSPASNQSGIFKIIPSGFLIRQLEVLSTQKRKAKRKMN